MTELNFSNIFGETNREYVFIGKGKISIKYVEKELISESGGTRLITKDKRGHYIPASWVLMVQYFTPETKIEFEKQLSDVDRKDISVEKKREYIFSEGNVLVINEPISIYVDSNGAHEILTDDSLITILPEWIKISWEPKPNEPTFVI